MLLRLRRGTTHTAKTLLTDDRCWRTETPEVYAEDAGEAETGARLLAVGSFGSEKNAGYLHNATVGMLHEDDPVWPNLLAETALPCGPLERLHIAPLRVVLLLEFVDSVYDPLPRVAGQTRKLLLGLAGEVSAPTQLLRRARTSTLRA